MSKPSQEIRPSQLVLSYGPGSIVETQSGPVVIGSLGQLFQRVGLEPDGFEIIDGRLSHSPELNGARIVRFPTNAELRRSQHEPIFPSTPFPFWSLCFKHGTEQILYPIARGGCPKCGGEPSMESGQNAVRFVTACPAGHLDEVNWEYIVHAESNNLECNPPYFLWHGGGRAMRQVMIQCPKCSARCNFGDAYGRQWPCRGRRIETRVREEQSRCEAKASIMQRGASNIRVASTTSALTVVDLSSTLDSVLRDRQVLTVAQFLKHRGILNREELLAEIHRLDTVDISEASIRTLQEAPWLKLESALNHLLDEMQGKNVRPIRDVEFEKLTVAAREGAPPIPPDTPATAPLFQVRREDVCQFTGPNSSRSLRVTPISRLRMVIVQTGYRRVDPENGRSVGVEYDDGNHTWYPGVELFGEGLFIDLAENESVSLHGPRAEYWNAQAAMRAEGSSIYTAEHVWWHTLSHRLLNVLAIDSGYSATSIRERIYRYEADGEARGGILLYTVQPGGDGTLGGLCSLARQFDRVIVAALASLGVCSNDPLCALSVDGGANGAACYSCLFASETSCEHHNRGLDRLLLLENPL